MMPVMGCPPQRPALGGAGTKNCKNKLSSSTCLEGFVRKIPVIKTGDRKHSDNKEADGKDHGEGTYPCEQGKQTGKV